MRKKEKLCKLMDLSGRAALVTGGYGIYGAPISEALAEVRSQCGKLRSGQ